MSKFKVGDKVRCIDAVYSYHNCLQHGRAYVIASSKLYPIGELVDLVQNNHSPDAHRAAHYAARFEKILPNPKKT